MRGRNFADVGGGKDACRAHRHSSEEAGDGEDCCAECSAGGDGADDEEDRRDDHDGTTAPDIREAAREEGAQCTAWQQSADRQAKLSLVKSEGVAKPLLRAVDCPGVISEHEAADRGNRDYTADQSQIDPLLCNPMHS